MDPALLCKIFFSCGTAVDLGGAIIPPFRHQIMNYGSRRTLSSTKTTATPTEQNKLSNLLGRVASFQVPHTWFTHYYVVSVASSLFWAWQILTRGRAFQLLAAHSQPANSGSMSVNQVLLAWSMMSIQGGRRLYESLKFTKPSQSKMWFGLWLIGIAYYIFMGVSVWIEGIPALWATQSPASPLELSKPSVKTSLAIPIFILASSIQHDCHRHLSSLIKYTLPDHLVFKSVVCPHYTAECLIYVALAIIAAPEGQFVNRTVLTGLGFVVTNLAVTADSTKKWYVEMFGAEKLQGRWRMVPYVY